LDAKDQSNWRRPSRAEVKGCRSRKFQLVEVGYAEIRSITLEFDYEIGEPPREVAPRTWIGC
jgi:hypothetical protein